MKTTLSAILGLSLLISASAATYSGNGASDFGGAVGTGSLTLTDNGTTVSGTFTRGSGNFNDSLVIYIDSVSGGFSSTSTFTDTADTLRRAISGYNGSTRTTATFAGGFQADYAIALGVNAGFGGLWQLSNPANHNFITSVNLNPNNNTGAASYTFSFNWSQIGLGTVSPGTSFTFESTYLNPDTAVRSLESFNGSLASSSGNVTFGSFGTFITSVPEPTNVALACFAVLGLGAAGFRFYRQSRPSRVAS